MLRNLFNDDPAIGRTNSKAQLGSYRAVFIFFIHLVGNFFAVIIEAELWVKIFLSPVHSHFLLNNGFNTLVSSKKRATYLTPYNNLIFPKNKISRLYNIVYTFSALSSHDSNNYSIFFNKYEIMFLSNFFTKTTTPCRLGDTLVRLSSSNRLMSIISEASSCRWSNWDDKHPRERMNLMRGRGEVCLPRHVLSSLFRFFNDAYLEKPRPKLSCHEDSALLGVIGNTVRLTSCSRIESVIKSSEINPAFNLPGPG